MLLRPQGGGRLGRRERSRMATPCHGLGREFSNYGCPQGCFRTANPDRREKSLHEYAKGDLSDSIQSCVRLSGRAVGHFLSGGPGYFRTCMLLPYSKPYRGSLHGYDVVDPNHLNPELGELSDLEGLAAELKTYNMGWIQDIVPNHMAMDSENRLLMDILENGSSSRYFRFFDIDGIIRPPASTREFWRHFLAGSMGSASKLARSPSNTVLTASR